MDRTTCIAAVAGHFRDSQEQPEVRLVGGGPDRGARLFETLRSRATRIKDDTLFHHFERDESLPLSAVPNAAELVETAQASGFVARFEGIKSGSTKLPAVSLLIQPGESTVFWDAGPGWDARAIAGLLDLLRDLLDVSAAEPATSETPESVSEEFVTVVNAWRRMPPLTEAAGRGSA